MRRCGVADRGEVRSSRVDCGAAGSRVVDETLRFGSAWWVGSWQVDSDLSW